MIGVLQRLEGEDETSAKSLFLSKSPESYWINFGDIGVFRMDDIKEVRYLVGAGIGAARKGNVRSSINELIEAYF